MSARPAMSRAARPCWAVRLIRPPATKTRQSKMAIGAPIPALRAGERRRIQLLAALFLVGGPRPVLRPLLDALVGNATRAEDPDGAAIVANAFTRAGHLGMYDAVRWLSLGSPIINTLRLVRVSGCSSRPGAVVSGQGAGFGERGRWTGARRPYGEAGGAPTRCPRTSTTRRTPMGENEDRAAGRRPRKTRGSGGVCGQFTAVD